MEGIQTSRVGTTELRSRSQEEFYQAFDQIISDNALHSLGSDILTKNESCVQFDYERRRLDDTITWLAEVLPGAMCTPVEYKLVGDELYTADGQPVHKMFEDSIEDAKNLPASLSFELRRRAIEKDEFYDMQKMARGELIDSKTGKKINTIVVESDYPPELMGISKDIGGYNGKRKTTMQRVITTTEGGIKIITTSLDRSNRQALEAIYTFCGYSAQPGELLGQRMHLILNEQEQELLPGFLREAYDNSLSEQFGGEWHAGRKQKKGVHKNTYEFVSTQTDLLDYYLKTTTRFSGGEAEYNLAAAMKKRFEQKERKKMIRLPGFSIVGSAVVKQELEQAGKVAFLEGEVFSGCGASISGEGAEDEYSRLGYGNRSIQDQFGPLKFDCQNGHENNREYGDLIEKCTTCGIKVLCKKD